jgi:phage/plasmid-like protein (TIGR03299 family)
MSHEIQDIDRVGLKGDQAWHGLGVVVADDLTAVQAADRFGMLWPVVQRPVFWQSADGQYQPVDSHVANIRTADADGNRIQEMLGLVGADYSVCQNRELAEFTDALAQTGRVVIESCGSIRGGKRVWFLARGDEFTIGDRDVVHPYVLVSNAHDGTQAIRITPTTVRVVCSNTLHMVIPSDEDSATRPETAAITIRHCGKIADKLEQARRAMAYYGDTLRRNRELFDFMQSKKVSHETVMRLFADSYSAFWEVAAPEELSSGDPKLRQIAMNRRTRMEKASAAFMRRYAGERDTLALGDTLWGAFNAMSGFLQHDKTASGSDDAARVARRMESNLFGVNAARTHEVLAASLALSI